MYYVDRDDDKTIECPARQPGDPRQNNTAVYVRGDMFVYGGHACIPAAVVCLIHSTPKWIMGPTWFRAAGECKSGKHVPSRLLHGTLTAPVMCILWWIIISLIGSNLAGQPGDHPRKLTCTFWMGPCFLLLWARKNIVFIVVAHCDQDYRCSLGSIIATSCDPCVLRWTIPPTERPTRIMDKSNLAWSNKQSECSPLPEWTDNTSQVEPVHVRHLDRARGTPMMIHRAKCD